MNDIFELKRFAFLFRKTIYERPAQLLGLTALALAASLIVYSGSLYFTGFRVAQNMAFVWGYAGGGCFLAAVAFAYFNTNAAGAAYLTLPASALEKWLCGILLVGVVFSTLFLSFYRLMDFCFVTAYHNGLDKNNPQYRQLYNTVRIYTFDNNLVAQSVVIFLNATGALMLGSLYFNKVGGIKTVMFYGGFAAFIYTLNQALVHAMFPNVDMAWPFSNVFIRVGNDIGSIDMPLAAAKFVGISFQYIIPVILWITVYIRLKEKEI
jgi:hypothetical protein